MTTAGINEVTPHSHQILLLIVKTNVQASDHDAVSQETELLWGGDLSENSLERSRSPAQSTLENDADSSSDDSDDSAGPGSDSSSSGESYQSVRLSCWPLTPAGLRDVVVGSRFFASNHLLLVSFMLVCFSSVHDSFDFRTHAVVGTVSTVVPQYYDTTNNSSSSALHGQSRC